MTPNNMVPHWTFVNAYNFLILGTPVRIIYLKNSMSELVNNVGSVNAVLTNIKVVLVDFREASRGRWVRVTAFLSCCDCG